MNNNSYKLSRVQPMPASVEANAVDLVTVEARPERRWRGAVPSSSALELRPQAEKQANEKQGFHRFYPPLLVLSTTLTGIFFWLYLTKPVVIEQAAPGGSPVLADAALPVADSQATREAVALQPWPNEDFLPGEAPGSAAPALTSTEPANIPGETEQTVVSALQTILVDTGEIPMERFEVEFPVLFESRTMAWDKETIAEYRQLAADIENHLKDVKIVRENGDRLLALYQSLLHKGAPAEALSPDSISLPAVNATGRTDHTEPQEEEAAHD